MNYDSQSFANSEKSSRYILVQKVLNRILNRFKLKILIHPFLNDSSDMVSDFQRMNFFHLLNRVIQDKKEGEIVELGCFEGQTALLFQHVIVENKSDKKLILFDNFRHDFGLKTDIKVRLIENFNERKLPIPVIVDGDFKETLVGNLPEKISFLHIDCGFGGDKIAHRDVILHALEHTYPRMSKGAIGVFMDYHDVNLTVNGMNINPGAKLAADLFFADKPEKMFVLYGGQFSHGYFVKG